LSFDGTDDYVELDNGVGDTSIIDFGTGSFSVEGWFRTDNQSQPSWVSIFRHGRQGPNSQVSVASSG
jgi:hypothetical protein